MQFAFMNMLPSVLLSGFAFPRAEMPSPICEATFLLPGTYFIQILFSQNIAQRANREDGGGSMADHRLLASTLTSTLK